MVDVVGERGWRDADLDEVAARAGVTREQLDRRFADKEACALWAFEVFIVDFEWRVESAYYSQPDWRTGLRAAAYAVADWMLENPNLIRFGAVEVLKAESEMLRVRREEALGYGARLIERGRAEAPDPDAVPDAAPLMAIGSIVQLLTHRLQTATELEVIETVPQMLYLAVRPYLGEERAREELTMPRPPPGD